MYEGGAERGRVPPKVNGLGWDKGPSDSVASLPATEPLWSLLFPSLFPAHPGLAEVPDSERLKAARTTPNYLLFIQKGHV